MRTVVQFLIKSTFIFVMYACLPASGADGKAAAASGKSAFQRRQAEAARKRLNDEESPSTYLVLYSIKNKEISVLIGRKKSGLQSNPNQWVFPGGGVDKSEKDKKKAQAGTPASTPKKAQAGAFKEFEEETHVDLLKKYQNNITYDAAIPFDDRGERTDAMPAYYCTFVRIDSQSLHAIANASQENLIDKDEFASVKVDTLNNAMKTFAREHKAKTKGVNSSINESTDWFTGAANCLLTIAGGSSENTAADSDNDDAADGKAAAAAGGGSGRAKSKSKSPSRKAKPGAAADGDDDSADGKAAAAAGGGSGSGRAKSPVHKAKPGAAADSNDDAADSKAAAAAAAAAENTSQANLPMTEIQKKKQKQKEKRQKQKQKKREKLANGDGSAN